MNFNWFLVLSHLQNWFIWKFQLICLVWVWSWDTRGLRPRYSPPKVGVISFHVSLYWPFGPRDDLSGRMTGYFCERSELLSHSLLSAFTTQKTFCAKDIHRKISMKKISMHKYPTKNIHQQISKFRKEKYLRKIFTETIHKNTQLISTKKHPRKKVFLKNCPPTKWFKNCFLLFGVTWWCNVFSQYLSLKVDMTF